MKPIYEGMLTLYQPLIDWVTLTSFHEWFYPYWSALIDSQGKTRDMRRIGYAGRGLDTGNGSIFVGQGTQKGKDHYIMQMGGENSHDTLYKVAESYERHMCRVTVFDLQVTVPEPEGWSQFELLKRMEEAGKLTGKAESRDKDAGRLETIYIGSWQSDRMIRVYVKLTAGNERLLRFEAHFKGLRADAAARSVMFNKVTPRQILLAEVQRLGTAHLPQFESCLSGVVPHHVKVKQKSSRAKTEGWIRQTVIPALARYANAKDADITLLDTIRKAITPPDRL